MLIESPPFPFVLNVMAERTTFPAPGLAGGAAEGAILDALQAAGDRTWPRMATQDWAGRGANQLSPPTYPSWGA